MTEPSFLPLGPWPLGVDNVHAPDHAVFQPTETRPARLLTATNVVLDDEGWVGTRGKTAVESALTNGLGCWSVAGRLFYQDEGSLYEFDNSTPLVTGLTSRIALGMFANRIYGTDGAKHFEIDGSFVRTWGLPLPTLVLAASTGTLLSPGRYLVQAVFVDARGNRGGTSAAIPVMLETEAGLSVTVTGQTASVVAVDLFLSGPNQSETSFISTVAITELGSQVIQLTQLPTTILDKPATEMMQGPPAGITGIAQFRGVLLVWRDNLLWRSENAEPHLFHMDDFYQFSGNIRAVAPLATGIWVATERGIWWVTGDEPPWIREYKSVSTALKGSAVVDGTRLPFLETLGPVALFMTPVGITVGLSSGEIVPITQNRYHVDTSVYTEAQFATTEHGILVNLL